MVIILVIGRLEDQQYQYVQNTFTAGKSEQANSTSIITTSHEALHGRKTTYKNCTVTSIWLTTVCISKVSDTTNTVWPSKRCLLITSRSTSTY